MNLLRPLPRNCPRSLSNAFQKSKYSLAASKKAGPYLKRNPSFNKINPTSTSTSTLNLASTTTTPPTTRYFHTSTICRATQVAPSFLHARTMATTSTAGIDQLVKLASNLSLDEIREKFPACYPEINPIDVYRLHLTNILEKITGVDPKIIYNAIQWTQGLDRGDVMIAVPALRVKGKKPDELAKEWSEKVRGTAS